ncbi:hypothetical protein N7462_004477 [Penicillium macrosclerotiorum]|uniref:uncharacterized protein n=1 Tax=Penicillium macrosclerotiorum TaxID=303699 RepID=UPI0025494D0D|nr:uncharacterized protein N7462_004477 [Penicillium macrosclerotiorum]KAJ5690085.1 hypothetical protein N7462_004477 [Penicillium macrosclerotiorum]
MSKDSSATHIHMHQPRLADFFEEFTRPHTSTAAASSANPQHSMSAAGGHQGGANAAVTYGSSSPSTIPSFLPIEDIYVPPQYQPPNPEDEDDVVPDQHAAFGITRAMDRRREAVWRDLGLEALVNGQGHGGGATAANGAAGAGAVGSGPGVTLRGSNGGAASASSAAVRVRSAGRKMGGRRVVCLR